MPAVPLIVCRRVQAPCALGTSDALLQRLLVCDFRGIWSEKMRACRDFPAAQAAKAAPDGWAGHAMVPVNACALMFDQPRNLL